MLAAGAMTLLKLAAGLLSGSLGVLSDAAHSGLDLVGATLTFFSVQVSDKPADEDHTYGHGKFENLSAFCEAILMAISCGWIIYEALDRIIHNSTELHHSVWPVLVLLTSIGVDFWRSRQLRAVAERTGSPALATDAFHFASDIWATLAVLCGLGASWLGERNGIAWLKYADPFAAVVVSLMILRLTLLLGRETVAVLMDEVPAETRRRLVREVEQVEGVLATTTRSTASSHAAPTSASMSSPAISSRRASAAPVRVILPTSRWRFRGASRLSTPASWCSRPPKQCTAPSRQQMLSSTQFLARPVRKASSTACGL